MSNLGFKQLLRFDDKYLLELSVGKLFFPQEVQVNSRKKECYVDYFDDLELSLNHLQRIRMQPHSEFLCIEVALTGKRLAPDVKFLTIYIPNMGPNLLQRFELKSESHGQKLLIILSIDT